MSDAPCVKDTYIFRKSRSIIQSYSELCGAFPNFFSKASFIPQPLKLQGPAEYTEVLDLISSRALLFFKAPVATLDTRSSITAETISCISYS